MSDETQKELGRLDADVANLQRDMTELKADMKAVLAAVNQAKGGWKTLMLISGVSGAAGALLAKLLPFIPMK